jgi:hypothetical protein
MHAQCNANGQSSNSMGQPAAAKICPAELKNNENGLKSSSKSNTAQFRTSIGRCLSYQAPKIPRNVRPSEVPVCGDRPLVTLLNPAETT